MSQTGGPVIESLVNGIRDAIDTFGERPDCSVMPPEPSKMQVPTPPDIARMYECCGGIALPTFSNGLWVLTPAQVVSAFLSPLSPKQIADGPVFMFASDGGGASIVRRHRDGSILYLPANGRVENGVYEPWAPVVVLADSLEGFLLRLQRELVSFWAGKGDRDYMV